MELDCYEEKAWTKETPLPEMREKRFHECRFTGCDFRGLNLSKARFSDVVFERCSWVGTGVENVRFQDVMFKECKVMGVDFTVCDGTFLEVGFEESMVQGCNFSGLTVKRARFVKSRVLECHFSESNFKGAIFSESMLEGSIFHHTNLEKADFRGAGGYAINPIENKLAGAIFSRMEAVALLQGLGIVID